MAVSTARIISYSPTVVTVHTMAGGGALPGPQTVRIEPIREPMRIVGEASTLSRQWIVVIGYKSHPTIADTSLMRGDRFTVDGVLYEVYGVKPATVGKLEAYCMAVR